MGCQRAANFLATGDLPLLDRKPGRYVPYTDRPGWEENTQNSSVFIFDESGMPTIGRQGDNYLAAIDLGIDR